jgi:hypothetical protein
MGVKTIVGREDVVGVCWRLQEAAEGCCQRNRGPETRLDAVSGSMDVPSAHSDELLNPV